MLATLINHNLKQDLHTPVSGLVTRHDVGVEREHAAETDAPACRGGRASEQFQQWVHLYKNHFLAGPEHLGAQSCSPRPSAVVP